jgi:RNA polymerase sigma factor (sigma-70 family)
MQDINIVIYDNIGLVMNQLKKLHLPFDPEAESIGYEALYRAASTYDESKGYRFSTYATCCIYNALGSHIRTLNKKRTLDVVSYNNIAYNEDGKSQDFLSLLASSKTTAEQEYLKQELNQKVCNVFENTFNKLTNEKHIAIISIWHESEYKKTNADIAKEVQVSQPYVNQVLNSFIHKLRKKLEAYYYE